MSFTVALTGGIGSGKTTVAGLFAEQGAVIVDTDAIAHELTAAQGEAMPAIVRAFGETVRRRDGSLDRVAMRRLCFSDPSSRGRLEAILHPSIRSKALTRCRRAEHAPYVLLVVPLLIESGAYREHVDRILVVDCAETRQIERVMARSALGEKEVREIMAAQASRAERLAAANDVLSNDVGRDALQAGVLALHQRYVELGRNPSPARNQGSPKDAVDPA
jgi:dephospho-CoA kinase